MGREEGGGFRMGNACKSMADSCQCMAKPPQYCKVISLQLIKIIGGKRKNKGKFMYLTVNLRNRTFYFSEVLLYAFFKLLFFPIEITIGFYLNCISLLKAMFFYYTVLML